MNISTLILFASCLLFSGFNFFVNLKLRAGWFKVFTFVCGVIGLLGAAYLLGTSFLGYIKLS